jgi:hypothetical protein
MHPPKLRDEWIKQPFWRTEAAPPNNQGNHQSELPLPSHDSRKTFTAVEYKVFGINFPEYGCARRGEC